MMHGQKNIEWSGSRFGGFTIGEEITSGTICTGAWVGCRAGLDVSEKKKVSYFCRDLNPVVSSP